jgi:hypothetical protein
MVLFVYADRDERMRLVRNFDRDETWQDRTGRARRKGFVFCLFSGFDQWEVE